MKPNPVILIASTLAMLVAVSQASAVPLYSQPWDGTSVAYASQNDTSGGGLGNFATAYDNFTLGSSATIGRGNFTGVYISGSGTINGFTVQFYADNAGQPGGSLYSAAIAGSGNEAFIGPGTACCFAYSYSLPVNFAANGGIEYWLSIVPNMPATYPQWFWATGTAYQDFIDLGRHTIPDDLAFALNSDTPLPSTVPLFTSGLAGLGLLRWRRKRKQAAA